MKTLYIVGWNILKIEGESDDKTPKERKVKEGGIFTAKVSLLESSHELSLLFSDFLKEEPMPIAYGASFSAVDRALQLAVSALWEKESALVEISIKGDFVHEKCRSEVVKVVCELTYTIESNGKDVFRCSPKEKLDIGKQLKAMAIHKLNHYNLSLTDYKRPIHLSAFLLFVRALKWLSLISPTELNEKEKEELQVLKTHCYNNLSHFHLIFGNFEKAVGAASTVLEQDPCNVKAFYRRGVANLNLKDYDKAEADLVTVIKLDPTNGAAKKHLTIIHDKRKCLDDELAQAMKKFLSAN